MTTGKSDKSGASSLRQGKTTKVVETEKKAKKPMSEADKMRLQYYDANPVPEHSIGIFYNRFTGREEKEETERGGERAEVERWGKES